MGKARTIINGLGCWFFSSSSRVLVEVRQGKKESKREGRVRGLSAMPKDLKRVKKESSQWSRGVCANTNPPQDLCTTHLSSVCGSLFKLNLFSQSQGPVSSG